jgi:hypothetical protein
MVFDDMIVPTERREREGQGVEGELKVNLCQIRSKGNCNSMTSISFIVLKRPKKKRSSPAIGQGSREHRIVSEM